MHVLPPLFASHARESIQVFIPICNRPLSKPSIFSQILKFKSELKDVAEDKEVAELQLQEVAGRWKSILKEKDVCIFSII